MLVPSACLTDSAARGHLCAHVPATALTASGLPLVQVAARQPVYAAGQAADRLFGIRQGAVMLTGHLADGRRQIFGFLFQGDTFGFAPDGAHPFGAVSLTRTTLCQLPLEAVAADRRLAERAAAALSDMLATAWTHQVSLGQMSAVERVATFLSGLWHRLGRPEELHLPMAVADIADHLGLRPETVSRSLTRLRRSGLVGRWDAYGFLPIYDGPGLGDRPAGRSPAAA